MTSLRASENVNKAGGGISALEDTLQQTGSNHDVASLRRMGACATSSKGILSQPLVVDPGQHGPPEYSPLSPDEKLLSQRGSTEPPPRMKYVIHNWRWEVFGVVVCVVATNAAIIVLKIYDKHPLSAWPLGIQLNSLVSVFVTITKACLLPAVAQSISQLKWLQIRRSRGALMEFQVYDDASRGPWGAVKLLLNLRCRYIAPLSEHLASLGALVLILSLAIDPFAQQLVAYPARQVISGTPTIRRTLFYNQESSGMDGNYNMGLENPMRGAVYNGIFAVEPVAELAPVCATGNCTWQLFSTLAFCSSCSNVTSSTTHVCKPLEGRPDLKTCNYTLPSGMNVTFKTFGAGSDILDASVLMNTSGTTVAGVYSPTFAFGLIKETFIDLVVSECALFFCIQTIDLAVLNGIPQSQTVSSWWPDEGTSVSNLVAGSNMTLRLPRSADHAMEDLTFTVETREAASLQAFLTQDMSGVPGLGSSLFNGTIKDFMVGMEGSDTLMAIYASQNISVLLTNIATTMTNVLRSYGDGTGQDTVFGTAYSMEVFIHVRWEWLALHVALLVISSVFLSTVIQISYRERAPVWKSSTLALLFHGIDEGERLGPLDDIQEMELRAKNIKVTLGDREAGYKLV